MAKRGSGKRRTGPDGTTVAGKAGNGSGSIYPDGVGYRATYLDPITGKRRTVSGRTKAIAAANRDARVAELAAAGPSSLGRSPSMADLAQWWLDDVAAPQVRPDTLHTYRKEVARIVGEIGHRPVRDLDAETVRSLFARLHRSGLAASSIRNVRARMRQLGSAAVDLGYLASNPVLRVPAPKGTAEDRRARRSLTPDEVRRLLGALDGGGRLDAGVAMLFTSGSRASEVLGLAWSDIDLDAGTALVRRACTYTGGGVGPRLDRPKTTATAGVHHLAPTVVTLLRRRLADQEVEREVAGDDWQQVTYEGQPLELVFSGALGGLPLRQKLYTAVQAACVAAGIDPAGVGTHTGRRSTVTALYVSGLPLDDVARHVGHSSPATTAGYVTDLGTRPADTAALAARLLDPAAD